MDAVRHLLGNERLSDDIGTIHHRVLHIGLDTLAKHLLVVIPHNRIAIHHHTGIFGVIYQRVADGLHIRTIGTYLMVGVHLTIDRVGIDMEGKDLQGIGMHEQGVALGIIDRHSPISHHRISGLLVIEAILALEHILVGAIVIDNITKRLTVALLTIEDTIAHEGASLVIENRTTIQLGLICLGVIIAVLGIDTAVA